MKAIKRIGLGALVVLMAISLSGCLEGLTLEFDFADNRTMAVVNQDGDGIGGIIVTFSDADATEVTSDTNGGIDVPSTFTSGTAYTATAELPADWTGPEYTFEPVTFTIGAESIYLGTIVGALPTLADAPTITAVDIKTGNPVDGAKVTLTYVDGLPTGEPAPTFDPVSTNSDGVADFGSIPYARYNVAATKSGYAFIDETIRVSGSDQQLRIVGFKTAANFDDTSITIATVWSEGFDDVDVHVTYPYNAAGDQGFAGDQTSIANPYDDEVDANALSGFLPNVETNRERVYYPTASKASTETLTTLEVEIPTGKEDFATEPAVELDVDDLDGGGPETVTIRAIPFDWFNNARFASDDGFAGDTDNLLPVKNASDVDYKYLWFGVMEVYVNAYNGDLMTADSDIGADVEMYVFQGSTLLGRYSLPGNTLIDAASVLRINLFDQYDPSADIDYEYFQIVPDIRIFNSVGDGSTSDYTSLRGLADGVINVQGAARTR